MFIAMVLTENNSVETFFFLSEVIFRGDVLKYM